MDFKGRIVDRTIDFSNMRLRVTFESENDIGTQTEELLNKALRVTVKQYRGKRSLDANAYYWQLLTKLADKVGVSNPYMHNTLLRSYGQPEMIDDKLVYLILPDSENGEMKALEAETYHIKPTSQVKPGVDGIMYRTYIMLRGSSTYDTKEMSRLIDGLVSECKEQGIDTMPPDEFKRMMATYENQWRKRHEVSATG